VVPPPAELVLLALVLVGQFLDSVGKTLDEEPAVVSGRLASEQLSPALLQAGEGHLL